jgi:hypothetical protein
MSFKLPHGAVTPQLFVIRQLRKSLTITHNSISQITHTSLEKVCIISNKAQLKSTWFVYTVTVDKNTRVTGLYQNLG